jgi:lipoprotein-anchoring transpeptidase ErfK/SrfK
MAPLGQPAKLLWTLGERFVPHRLKGFEVLVAFLAVVLVSRHGGSKARERLVGQKHNSSRAPGLNCALASLDFACLAGKGFDRKFFMRSPFNASPMQVRLTPRTRLFPMSIFAVSALLISSCEEDLRYSGQTQYLGGIYGNQPTSGAPVDNVSYWDGDHIGGKATVKISLKEQRAYFYKSGMLVGISQLSTGREGLKTPTGTFSIIQKDINHVSTKYGDFVDDAGNVVKPNVAVGDPKPPGTHFKGAPMPYFMRIVDGVGMHAGYLPGYPASHGCIRMPEFMAQAFFKSIAAGTPVTITN